MLSIRTAARALILFEDRLLAIKMRDRSGVFYILPGGGQRHGETLQEALMRECLEEIDAHIQIGELLYVREYIGKNHEFRHHHRDFHQLEVVFRCFLSDPDAVAQGANADKKQVGVEWIHLDELDKKRFLPSTIKSFFNADDFTPKSIYLGDVN